MYKLNNFCKWYGLVQIESICRRLSKSTLNGKVDRVENIVGKGENAGYQHFLLFPQCFQTGLYPGSFKAGFVWYGVETSSGFESRFEILNRHACPRVISFYLFI